MNTPDNRTIHVFNGGMQAIQRFADAIASKLVTSLFNCGDRLHWLDDAGKHGIAAHHRFPAHGPQLDRSIGVEGLN